MTGQQRHGSNCRWWRPSRIAAAAAAALLAVLPAGAQQVADSSYSPPIERPTFAPGEGPLVLIDEAHNNFHTVDGRFYPFAQLLRRDGYRVAGLTSPLSAAALAESRVLVIANPLAARNVGTWALPTPSAFTAGEIDAVADWVRGGGSLLLIADHMPFAGAAAELALHLGLEFRNGFAVRLAELQSPLVFRAADGSLRPHSVTSGRSPAERVDSVGSFTGSAFRAVTEGAQPVLVLPADAQSWEPDTAWVFHDATSRVPVGGWLQGAVREFGNGRVAVFGEAAMFTAQLAGAQRVPAGMNDPAAPQNYRLVLNIIRWLARAE